MSHKHWGWTWAMGPVVLAHDPWLAPSCSAAMLAQMLQTVPVPGSVQRYDSGGCCSQYCRDVEWWDLWEPPLYFVSGSLPEVVAHDYEFPSMEVLVQLVRMEILAVSNSPVSRGLEDGRGLTETELLSSNPKAASFRFPVAHLEEEEKERSQFCGKSC